MATQTTETETESESLASPVFDISFSTTAEALLRIQRVPQKDLSQSLQVIAQSRLCFEWKSGNMLHKDEDKLGTGASEAQRQ